MDSRNENDMIYRLEETTVFSNSLVWGLENESRKLSQRSSEPNSVTLAKAANYSSLIASFLLDLSIKGDSPEPVCILEFSSSQGPFTYYILKRLTAIYRESTFNLPPFIYISAISGEEEFERLSSHPRLIPFIESHVLDFTDYKIEERGSLNLKIRGRNLESSTLQRPLLVLTDNSLSPIPSTLLYSDGEALAESYLSLSSRENPADISLEKLEESLNFDYSYGELDRADFDPISLNICEQYRLECPFSHLPLPLKALDGLKGLKDFSTKGLFILASDKGPLRVAEMEATAAPEEITELPGFNFNFLKRYIEQAEGVALLPKYKQYLLNTAAFLWLPEAESYRESILTYNELINRLSPDDMSQIYSHLSHSGDLLSIPQALSYLRLSHYDYELFKSFYPRLVELAANADETDSLSLLQMAGLLWDNYFPSTQGESELPNMLGNLLLVLSYFSEALTFYRIALEINGSTANNLYNSALCYFYMEDNESALQNLKEALSLSPHHQEAKELKKRIKDG